MTIIDQYNGDATHSRLFAAWMIALVHSRRSSRRPSTATRRRSSPTRRSRGTAPDASPFTPERTRSQASCIEEVRRAVPQFVDERLNDAIEAYDISDELFVSAAPKTAAAAAEYAVPSQGRLRSVRPSR
jgi:hypothetical protein